MQRAVGAGGTLFEASLGSRYHVVWTDEDVSGWMKMWTVHRRRKGGTPPPPRQPKFCFGAFGANRIWAYSFWPAFGGDHRGIPPPPLTLSPANPLIPSIAPASRT